MIRIAAICCTILIALSTSAIAAQKRAPPQKTETLACRLGTEDRHARIAVVLIGGKTDSFAYYSKWKPRTCSIYLQRNRDILSKWADNGNITTINLERGAFLIEHKKGEYHFVFRDVDRERYCGMDGQINGSLTIRKGSEQCQLEGIMEEGTALGKAFENMEPDPPRAQASEQPVPAPSSKSDAATPRPVQPPIEAVPVKVDSTVEPVTSRPAGAADAAKDSSGQAAPVPAAQAETAKSVGAEGSKSTSGPPVSAVQNAAAEGAAPKPGAASDELRKGTAGTAGAGGAAPGDANKSAESAAALPGTAANPVSPARPTETGTAAVGATEQGRAQSVVAPEPAAAESRNPLTNLFQFLSRTREPEDGPPRGE